MRTRRPRCLTGDDIEKRRVVIGHDIGHEFVKKILIYVPYEILQKHPAH